MQLWSDLERLCATIKYDSGKMDPNEVRSTLRRAQYLIEVLSPLLLPDTMTVRACSDDYADYDLTITSKLTVEQYKDILELMIDRKD